MDVDQIFGVCCFWVWRPRHAGRPSQPPEEKLARPPSASNLICRPQKSHSLSLFSKGEKRCCEQERESEQSTKKSKLLLFLVRTKKQSKSQEPWIARACSYPIFPVHASLRRGHSRRSVRSKSYDRMVQPAMIRMAARRAAVARGSGSTKPVMGERVCIRLGYLYSPRRVCKLEERRIGIWTQRSVQQS